MSPVTYRVSWPQPHSHLVHVELEIEDLAAGEPLDLKMPVWIPGSYLVREFGRRVEGVEVVDDAGSARPVPKIDKATWRVADPGARVRVRYRVYAHEVSVRASHLDASHAFLNGADLFLYADATRDRACRLELAVPGGWSVATALTAASPDEPHVLLASDYDHLVDGPVEVGTHDLLRFDAAGAPHEVAIWGEGNHDRAAVRRDLAAVVEAGAGLFGGLPYERYLFITHLTDARGGGLEHCDSSVLGYPRFGFRPRKDYEEFLMLACHEHFHVWNVKRIRPAALGRYDYDREVYTGLLWAMEGITDYYAPLLCRRAELLSVERFLSILGERMTRLARIPGRGAQSLEEAGRDAWVKLYRPDENTLNSTVSYYLKGSLVALVLDLELRARSEDRASLDDVMRALWRRAQGGGTIEEGSFGEHVREATGVDVEDLLERYVRGVDEVDLTAALAHVGLAVGTREATGPEDAGGTPPPQRDADEIDRPPRPYLGAALEARGGLVGVRSVRHGSPAEQGGVYPGDAITAVDGWRVSDPAGLDKVLGRLEPGSEVTVALFRRDRLIEARVTLGAAPETTIWLEARPDATDTRRARFEAWAGAPLPSSPS